MIKSPHMINRMMIDPYKCSSADEVIQDGHYAHIHLRRLPLKAKTVSNDEQTYLHKYLERNIDKPEYYHQNGLQRVYPYYHTYSSYVTRHLVGRTVLDVCLAQIPSCTPEYFKQVLEDGRITVNGEAVKPDFILNDGQFLHQISHRHEKPIKQASLEILVDNDEVLVINKPCSWPVHPTTGYKYNSLMMMLDRQFGYENLICCYRLDRMTSGVFIMGKTLDNARKIYEDITERRITKEYIARVVGRFPDGIVECSVPLLCVSRKFSLYRVDPTGKNSSTSFERLSYNGKTSVVRCMPHTGRTHQIRLHLQYLGHPIVNDSLYNKEESVTPKSEGVRNIHSHIYELEEEKHKTICTTENPLYKKKLAAVNQRNLNPVEETQNSTSKFNNENCNKAETYKRFRTIGCDRSKNNLFENISKDSNNNFLSSDMQMSDLIHIGDRPTHTGNRNKSTKREVFDFAEMSDDPSGDIALEPSEEIVKLESASANEEDKNHDKNELNAKSESIKTIIHGTENFSKSGNLEENTKNYYKNNSHLPVADRNKSAKFNDSDTEKHTTTLIEDNLDIVDIFDTSGDKRANIGFSNIVSANKGKVAILEDYNEEKMLDCIDIDCRNCRRVFEEPSEEDLIMYLHAYRYKGPDWEYSAPLPDWAQKDWPE